MLRELRCSTRRRVQMKKLLWCIPNCRIDAHVNAELYRGKCRYRFCSKWLESARSLSLSLSLSLSSLSLFSFSLFLSLSRFRNRLWIEIHYHPHERWHRAYIIFLWISISADTSPPRLFGRDANSWVRRCKFAERTVRTQRRRRPLAARIPRRHYASFAVIPRVTDLSNSLRS